MKRDTRGRFLKWLRRIHSWVGLWGALAGLLFGLTGFLLNHRDVFRLPSAPPKRATVHIDIPQSAQVSTDALTAYLRHDLRFVPKQVLATREPAQLVRWGDQRVTQPEHWVIRLSNPKYLASAEYWKGSNAVTLTINEYGWISAIERLHNSNSVSLLWILLADSIAGAMIALSISGVLLWHFGTSKKLSGVAILSASIMAVVGCAMWSFR